MRLLFALVSCLMLGACFTTGKRGGEMPLAIYDFGPQPAAKVVRRPYPLALEVRAPLWFDSMGVDYRLLYVDRARLREYARARWAGPPAQMIQQRLTQQLAFVASGQGQSRCLLRLELTDFSQLFDSPDLSHGVLQGRAQLLDRTRRLLAELPIDLRQPAPTADARGGVAALTSTVERLVDELAAWEADLKASGDAGQCAG